jgi:hypothetical protein
MARHLAHRVDGERDAEERLAEARRFVAEIKGWYLDVFDAIVRNGNDREKSIREIGERCASRDAAKKRYFRARSKLVKLMYLFERISPR